jgi:hypothetical protein
MWVRKAFWAIGIVSSFAATEAAHAGDDFEV